MVKWCISTSCLTFHSMVKYIISTLICFRSVCQNNNCLCTAIHIQHKELHFTTYPDSCLLGKVCSIFKVQLFVMVKWWISTCCIKFHSAVIYISSALNCCRSICQTNNSLCIAIYIWHKEFHHFIPDNCCVYWERSVAF